MEEALAAACCLFAARALPSAASRRGKSPIGLIAGRAVCAMVVAACGAVAVASQY